MSTSFSKIFVISTNHSLVCSGHHFSRDQDVNVLMFPVSFALCGPYPFTSPLFTLSFSIFYIFLLTRFTYFLAFPSLPILPE